MLIYVNYMGDWVTLLDYFCICHLCNIKFSYSVF